MGLGGGGRRTRLLLASSRLTIDHASLKVSRRSRAGGEGVDDFILVRMWLLTNDDQLPPQFFSVHARRKDPSSASEWFSPRTPSFRIVPQRKRRRFAKYVIDRPRRRRHWLLVSHTLVAGFSLGGEFLLRSPLL